jgi:tape measure domain-containing protein
MSASAKGLKDVGDAANKIDMGGLANGVETVKARFSALQVIGVTALANITNSAVNTGKRMIKALTIDPIKTGFSEYELKMNSIQTIMSNTANKGTTMKDVTRVLDELNTYADKTIYNFAEMTRNIGTFTAAGVGLEDSAAAIQGIANLAAASGSNSQQASTAMYQLSQALAAGTVKLMDWNSVVNAGMGGQKFQEALKATARDHGIAVDDMIKKNGSFRESLQEGWITADVLNETLKKFTVDGAKEYAKSMMDSGKWTKKQADALIKEAKAMNDAATKVKTFTQLWDTLKEAAQSGWAQSWEIIIGNFTEAKKFLTEISDTIGGILGKQAEARNKILQGWKDLGGRTAIIDSIRNVFEGLVSVVKPIHQAFKEVIPPITAKKLYDFSVGLKKLTEGFKLSDENADKLKRTFKGLFSIVDFFRKIINAVAKVIGSLFTSGSVNGVLDLILTITASIGDFFTAINSGFNLNGLTSIFSGIAQVIGGVVSGLSGAGDALTGIGRSVAEVVNSIWTTIKEFFSWVTGNISFSDIFAGLAGGGIFLAAKKLKGLFEDLSEMTSGGLLGLIFGKGNGDKGTTKPKFLEQFSNVLGSVNESLQAFTGGIKVASLVAIASAIAILSNALKTISELNAVDVGKSLMAMGLMFGMLTTSFKSLTKALNIFPSKGIVKAGISMMLIAKAIDILAGAMKEIGSLSLEGVAKGLAGIGGSMLILVGGLKAIQGSKVSISAIITVTVLANAMKTMSKSLVELGSLKWGEVGRGLTAMGGALTELLVTMKILSKVGGAKSLTGSIGLLIMTKSLGDIADALKKLGKMSWGEIARGLSAMGGALVELGAVMVAVGKLGGLSGIVGAAVIVEGARSLEDIANALVKVGQLSWGEIARGLTGIGGALTELATISALLGKLGGLSGLVGAVALVEGAKALGDVAKAFTVFSGMKWKEIKIGLAGMGGALAEVAVITGALGKLAGFSGLLGAGSILLAVQSLGDITDAFKVFEGIEWGDIGKGIVGLGASLSLIAGISGALGKIAGFSGLLGAGTILIACKSLGDIANALKEIGVLSWAEIARGLAGMGGALLEVAAISGGLGTLAGLSGLLGSGAIALACTGLEEIGNTLKKLGSMSWSEIGRGLAAMGAALGELAIGSVLNTFSMLGALSISAVAEPLGKLADSLKKWCGLKLPENLGGQLGKLAVGVTKFTFGGFGASAIATVAEPLGTLAGSIKKWSNVTVPENIADQLTNLAKGVKAFTWAFLGGMSMDTAVEPLGKMASAVKKWNGVTVPEGLGDQLKSLSPGVKAFTFGGNGASALSEVAGPLGTLAASVKKWTDVTVPENIGTQLSSLASGVSGFNAGKNGATAIAEVATPIGTLAGSIKKWADVSIPENLGTQLTNLGRGVKAFNFGGSGASALSEAGPGLGKLASAVKKWAEVTIPENLGTQLRKLASGVKGFTFGGNGASAISEAGPALIKMASAVKKWIGLTVPDSLGEQLKQVAKAVKSFTFGGNGASALNEGATGLSTMASAVKKWTGITVPENLGTQLGSLSTAIKKFSTSGNMESGAKGIQSIANSIKKLNSVKFDSIISGIKSFTKAMGSLSKKSNSMSGIGKTISESIIEPINKLGPKLKSAGSKMGSKLAEGLKSSKGVKSAASSLADSASKGLTTKNSAFKSAGSKMATAFASGLKSGKGAKSAAKSLVSSASKAVNSNSPSFKSAGSKMATAFASGLKSGKGASSAAKSMASKAAKAISTSGFKSAGKDAAKGFANGISANTFMATAKAKAMGEKALSAARKAIKVNSPSKEFMKLGRSSAEGFALGIDKDTRLPINSATRMAVSAIDSTKEVISKIGRLLDSDVDVQPTISPVVDLSNVKAGAGAINGLLGQDVMLGASANLSAINYGMSRNQNGVNDDVVSAINKLRKDLGNISGDTYQINGVTYDDGSNITDAVHTLVRAAKVERRK